jgi:hypothetical protein
VTQVVAAGNWTYAIVAADRRFTYEGKLLSEDDDERNKLILVATPTARLAVAFCGLATLGSFQTEPWLAHRLHEALNKGGSTPDLEWLCDRANADFSALPPDAIQRRVDSRCVWITLAGFVSEREGVMPVFAFVNNAHSADGGIRAGKFRTDVFGPARLAERATQRAFALSMGAAHVAQSRVDELKRIVAEDGAPAAAIGAALRTIRAAREARGDLVGPRCGAVVVWSERDRQPEGHYFGRAAPTHFMPTLVTRRGVELNVTVDRKARPVARNAVCSCGSGRTYRRCHGASTSAVRGR